MRPPPIASLQGLRGFASLTVLVCVVYSFVSGETWRSPFLKLYLFRLAVQPRIDFMVWSKSLRLHKPDAFRSLVPSIFLF